MQGAKGYVHAGGCARQCCLCELTQVQQGPHHRSAPVRPPLWTCHCRSRPQARTSAGKGHGAGSLYPFVALREPSWLCHAWAVAVPTGCAR